MSNGSLPSERYLCCECVGDKYLRNEIVQAGFEATCVCCKERRASIRIGDLAERIDAIPRECFHQVDPDDRFGQSGESLNWRVQEIVGVESDFAEMIIAAIPEEDTYHIVKDGGSPFYDDTTEYAPVPAYTGELSSAWEGFCFNIKHTSRFFSTNAEERLRRILSGVERYHAAGGRPAIREIAPGTAELSIFRARVALSAHQVAAFIEAPEDELGPPPSSKAVAGRMNPAGISLFYGATEALTCIAEIRPPVGSYVVSARFEALRPLRVLDLTVLDDAFAETSYFDPMFQSLGKL